MKRVLLFMVVISFVGGTTWWYAAGRPERSVRRTVEQLEEVALSGVNQRDVSMLDTYFASEAEGAIPSGLAATRDALRIFATQLSGSDQVQVHSFQIQDIRVHERDGLADVTYRLHFSIVRGGGVMFSATAVQNLALLQTPRGWRIMGGDQPQLTDVMGTWPPIQPAVHG
jgi:hypothetical protein